jgi:hypothetical protein
VIGPGFQTFDFGDSPAQTRRNYTLRLVGTSSEPMRPPNFSAVRAFRLPKAAKCVASDPGYRCVLVCCEVLEDVPASFAGLLEAGGGVGSVLPLRRLRFSLRADDRIDSWASPSWEGWGLQTIWVLAISVHDPRSELGERFVGPTPGLSDDGLVVIHGTRGDPEGGKRPLHECRG